VSMVQAKLAAEKRSQAQKEKELAQLALSERDARERNAALVGQLERAEAAAESVLTAQRDEARRVQMAQAQMRASEAQAEKAAAEASSQQDAAASLRQDLQRELDHVAELQRQVERLTRDRVEKEFKQALRLQVLAPKVSVSVAGNVLVDVEAAPGRRHIQQVLEREVLPRFLQAFIAEEEGWPAEAAGLGRHGPNVNAYVQQVLNDMVASIEEKLKTVFGDSCVRV